MSVRRLTGWLVGAAVCCAGSGTCLAVYDPGVVPLVMAAVVFLALDMRCLWRETAGSE